MVIQHKIPAEFSAMVFVCNVKDNIYLRQQFFCWQNKDIKYIKTTKNYLTQAENKYWEDFSSFFEFNPQFKKFY